MADEEKRHAELGIAMKELDKLDEVHRPSLEVGSKDVDFGNVRFV